MKTKAAVLRNIGGPLIIEELEIPKLGFGQVLVKILYSGLCRSQLNEIKGWKGKDHIPHLLGHEASGEVLEIGDSVSKVRPGDYVVCSWIKGAGLDVPLIKYRAGDGSVVNAGAVATFSQYAVISENRLVPVSRKIGGEVAALLGCAVPTGAGVVDHSDIPLGSKLAIFGIGGIGASALLKALSLKIRCFAIDVAQWKLDWAEKIGSVAIHFDHVKKYAPFDSAVECSGSRTAMEAAINLTKSDGAVIVAGNLEPGEKIAIDPFDLVKGKRISGTWGGGCFLDDDIPRYASEYLFGYLSLENLITRIYSFEKINLGLAELNCGELIRGIVKIS
ncbi:alcohol dehydrogenase catalytic domain-containing protein [Patescibacteria group bacterium]|nr:alcohol dehydrogenase catalytic domain-containing protein [Patescibacteria group bacterium]